MSRDWSRPRCRAGFVARANAHEQFRFRLNLSNLRHQLFALALSEHILLARINTMGPRWIIKRKLEESGLEKFGLCNCRVFSQRNKRVLWIREPGNGVNHGEFRGHFCDRGDCEGRCSICSSEIFEQIVYDIFIFTNERWPYSEVLIMLNI